MDCSKLAWFLGHWAADGGSLCKYSWLNSLSSFFWRESLPCLDCPAFFREAGPWILRVPRASKCPRMRCGSCCPCFGRSVAVPYVGPLRSRLSAFCCLSSKSRFCAADFSKSAESSPKTLVAFSFSSAIPAASPASAIIHFLISPNQWC